MTQQTDGILLTGYKARYYELGNYIYGAHNVTNFHTDLVDLQPGQKLLDVGCGTAVTLDRLNRQFGSCVNLFGIDPSVDMITMATKKVGDTTGIDLRTGIAESLEFVDGTFDWVISCLTPHHLPHDARRQMFAECYRVLKPDGRLLISDFGPSYNVLGRLRLIMWRHHAFVAQLLQGEVFAMMKQAGFRLIGHQTQFGAIHHVLACKGGSGESS